MPFKEISELSGGFAASSKHHGAGGALVQAMNDKKIFSPLGFQEFKKALFSKVCRMGIETR